MRMGIQATILGSFAVVVCLLAAFLAVSLWDRRTQAETIAATEAEHVATVIAATIVRSDPEGGIPALFENHAALQRYVEHLHALQRRDLEVVDATGRILADVVTEDIGHSLDGELAAAADRVRRTAAPQRFIEVSKDYPRGSGRWRYRLFETGRSWES
jgi:hypothetical protein